MGVVFADYDHDGFTDVFVANDNAPNMLFHNLGGKKFEEVALRRASRSRNRARTSPAWVPISKTSTTTDGMISGTPPSRASPSLCSGIAERRFRRDHRNPRPGQRTRNMPGWSNGIVDLDNDGWKDLFVVRGNVQDNIALMSYRKYEEPNSVFAQSGQREVQGRERRGRRGLPEGGSPSRRRFRRHGQRRPPRRSRRGAEWQDQVLPQRLAERESLDPAEAGGRQEQSHGLRRAGSHHADDGISSTTTRLRAPGTPARAIRESTSAWAAPARSVRSKSPGPVAQGSYCATYPRIRF